MKPIADAIDKTEKMVRNATEKGGYRIRYKCPTCDNRLSSFLLKDERFCHYCGQSLSWGVVMAISKTYSDILDELSEKYNDDISVIFEKGLLLDINEYNEENDMKESLTYVYEE